MAAKIDDALIDQFVADYVGGDSACSIADHYGFDAGTVTRRLRSRGVLVSPTPNRIDLPVDEIASRYRSGETELSLANAFGVSRNVVARRLQEAGIERRGVAEMNRINMARRTPEERQRNAMASHEAIRGSKRTVEDLSRRALAHERHPTNVGCDEIVLAKMLADRGVTTVPQKAIGPYNCDLAAFPVAVEVFGGNFHFYGRHWARMPKRLRYLFDSGWHVLMVHVTKPWPLDEGAAYYIAAYVEACRRHPTGGREYRMIRGTGQLAAIGRGDDDERTIVETLSRARNRRCLNAS
jgi:hypothetical protein